MTPADEVPGDATASPTHDAHHRERLREALTMALYIGLSLLAVMVALPADAHPSGSASPALALALTAIGLLVAHWFAFRLSTRLVHRGRLGPDQVMLLAAQLIGGLGVTAVVVIPVLLFGAEAGVIVAELLLVGFVGAVGYAAARSIPMGRARAMAYVGVVVVVALAVIGLKNLVGH